MLPLFTHQLVNNFSELTLATGGYHLVSQIQREHSIAFLRRVQDVMGFKTHHTIALLQSQWQDLDGSVAE